MDGQATKRRQWRWRDGLLVGGIFCLVVIAGYAATFLGGRSAATAAAEAKLQAAPNFVLRDQYGQLTSLAQFRGRVVVLAFLDPDCTQICPLTSQILLGAMRRLGPAAAGVQLLGINVNLKAATVTDVAAYSRIHLMNGPAAGGHWRFLTGPAKRLRRVWKNFGVYVATPHGELVHQAAVVIVGRRGWERDAYVTPMRYDSVPRQAARLAAKIAPLLGDSPALPPVSATPYPPPLPPARPETLAVLNAPGSAVDLGAGHPHLVCFFADWLGATTNLPRHLAQLDSYAAAARRHGWPMPVAIDELPTEPSPARAQARLRQLGKSLTVPIATDVSGRIADGYNVDDLPWLALTSASGKIVWQHDGWLRAGALERQLQAALRSASGGSSRRGLRPGDSGR